MLCTFTFTFMHLADAFIQSDIFCQYVCSLGIEPTTFVLLTQCSTTEPQEQPMYILLNKYFCCTVFKKLRLLFWRAAVTIFYISVCIWYEDSFTQMKRWNAHDVTLRAVLEMLFVYLCPHWDVTHASVYVCVLKENTRFCHTFIEIWPRTMS